MVNGTSGPAAATAPVVGQPQLQAQATEAQAARRNAALEVRIADTAGYESRCPDCNAGLIYQEGCARCSRCGWNRCE